MKSAAMLIIASLSLPAFGAGFLEFRDEGFKSESIKEKKWQITMGADYLNYQASLPAYSGKHEKIDSDENSNIYGVSIGFGREFRVAGDFSITPKLGGFYTKTLQRNVGKASKDIDLDLSSVRDDHMVYGGEVSASLNYLFENSILNLQPFFEAGVGTGIANIQKEYIFDGIQSDRSDAEDYDVSVDENFNYTRASLGVNFISTQGVLSYVKVTQMVLDVTKRKTKGSINGADQSKNESDLNERKDFLAASIGFGYLF